ncbi:hypothetical protein ACFWED_22860 [Streptomyces anulatus]|uniref:hypothetical protein n=1 Tax=Streptomyces anulatus TaxID=1892 RepID=UPI003646911A
MGFSDPESVDGSETAVPADALEYVAGNVGAAFIFAGKELFEVRFDVVGGGDGR